MNLISRVKKIKNKISANIEFNENLSKHSWFNLGGPAKIIFRPKTLNELSLFLKSIKDHSKVRVLGAGSNTLFRDGGYDGIVIKLGKSFSKLSLFNKNTIIVGASAMDKEVSKFAANNSISGLEFLSCIPGTIGGGIRMNSGCYENDISKILISVQVMNLDGKIQIINSSNINFSYRNTDLSEDLIFISATLKGEMGIKKKIQEKINKLVNKKNKDQPSKIKTCGSTFKNPKNNKAWKLIKESGCSNMRIGDAQISTKHCNFFINKGKAKSKDLENLIQLVQKKVFDKTGINLEPEIKIVGEKL